MDREKVIKGIEMCISQYECSPDDCQYYERTRNESGLCWDRLMTDALALLKEQEAVEPIITPWAEDEDGNIVVAKKECGKCGYQFFTEQPNFCENCGTPILWEGR